MRSSALAAVLWIRSRSLWRSARSAAVAASMPPKGLLLLLTQLREGGGLVASLNVADGEPISIP